MTEEITQTTPRPSTQDLSEQQLSSLSQATQNGRKGPSWVWPHFRRINDGVMCIKCETTGTGSHLFSDKTSTASLAKHLVSQHGIGENSMEVTHNPIPDKASKAEINAALLRWIVSSSQALRTVDDIDFRKLVSLLEPSYQPPSRTAITRLMAESYENMKPTVMMRFNATPGPISLTCDGWSSRILEGYFVVTAHWLTETFHHESVILEFKNFPPPHNGITTADMLKDVITSYNLIDRVSTITTDSGSEMPVATRIVKEWLNGVRSRPLQPDWHIRCLCHVIDRAVRDSLQFISPMIEKLRYVLKGIKASSGLREKFKKIQLELPGTAKCDVPPVDVATRWSSTYKMCLLSYKCRYIIDTVLDDAECSAHLKSNRLDTEDWRDVNHVMMFHKKAAQFTKVSSGRKYTTISFQPQVFRSLRKLCLDTEISDGPVLLRHSAKAFRQKMEKYESHLCCPSNVLALDLDPRARKNGADSVEKRQRLRDALRDRLSLEPEQREQLSDVRGLAFTDEQDMVQDYDEVDDYCELIGAGDRGCQDASKWWRDIGRHRFPNLAKLARSVLMALASSVPSESAFSKSGEVVRRGRCRLTRENIRKLMQLQSWYSFMDMDRVEEELESTDESGEED